MNRGPKGTWGQFVAYGARRFSRETLELTDFPGGAGATQGATHWRPLTDH